MPAIKNVAVVGASGNIGKPIVDALLAAGFSVTALTRESSSASFPEGVAVKKVDYESVDSLRAALAGQDAVVSATASASVGKQYPIVDAAIAEGVKRFIPSEFGIHTRTVQHPGLKSILGGKIKTLDYIIEAADKNPEFTWTAVTNGLFFDWGLKKTGIGFNKEKKSFRRVDAGNTPFFVSNLPFIGRAVAAILANPEKTANQYLSIASATTTQNELLKIVEEETKEKWTVEPVSALQLDDEGRDKLARGDFSAFGSFLQAYLFGDLGDSTKGVELANDLLGLQEEDIRVTLKEFIEGKL